MQHESAAKPRERNPHIRQLQQNKELVRVPDHVGRARRHPQIHQHPRPVALHRLLRHGQHAKVQAQRNEPQHGRRPRGLLLQQPLQERPLGFPPARDEPPAGVELRQRPARLDVGVLGPCEAGGDVGDDAGGGRSPATTILLPAPPAVGGDELAQQRGQRGEEVGGGGPGGQRGPVEGDGLLEEAVRRGAGELHVREGVGPEELGGRGGEHPAHVVEGDGDEQADGAVAAAVRGEGPAQGGDGVHPRHVCYEGVPCLRELVQGRSILVSGDAMAAVGFAAAFAVHQDRGLPHDDSRVHVAGHGWLAWVRASFLLVRNWGAELSRKRSSTSHNVKLEGEKRPAIEVFIHRETPLFQRGRCEAPCNGAIKLAATRDDWG
ncbi:unnamed protein product [Clonostachys solani]|uniref:Uncharacterized protein n=1 Tax=Clonostachys solani TaxID=160281 RepID=A0A9N9Z3P9_9HYPO|nr:unnamed protein product [Clonostachys solani]